MQVTQLTQPIQTRSPRQAQRRRWAVAAGLLVLLLLLMALFSLGDGTPSSGAGTAGRASSGNGTDDDRSRSNAATDEDDRDATDNSDDVSADVELSSGDADPGDPADVDFDPVGDPVDPCAGLPAGQGNLLVVPDPLVLPSGDLDDELHVRNCGPATVSWTAATKPTVSLASAAGTLAPGELTTLGFAIDSDGWEPGAIDFKIKVSEPGHNTYVDVHAFRPAVGADFVAGTELSAGPHVGGCADQCITKALLSTGYGSPDVGLDVGTTVPAKVRVYLSKQAPVINPAGNPVFPGTPPKATSPDGVETWQASLSNLQPGTKYFIIVRATDDDGDTAYRSGSFRTITPFVAPGGLAPNDPEPGCSNQCIAKAVVSPGRGTAPSHLVVETHTPAQLQLMLSTEAPTYEDGVPDFAKKPVWLASGLDYIEAWEQDVNLAPGTTYHGIVVALDANGHRSYAVGRFTTGGVDILITVHEVHVTQDGDSGKRNRGELSFAWGVGEDTAGTRGEEKMHAGAEVQFGRSQSAYVVRDAAAFLPTVYMEASERDGDGLVEFCARGGAVSQASGSSGGCDSKWNVAASDPVQLSRIGLLADCSSFGVGDVYGDEPCMRLVGEDLSDDYAEFWAIVSFSVVD